MNREVHVRICESRGLRRPPATRPRRGWLAAAQTPGCVGGAGRVAVAVHHRSYSSPRIAEDLRGLGWRPSVINDKPAFVEDIVRDVSDSCRRRQLSHRIEARNFESIHGHDAFASVTWAPTRPDTTIATSLGVFSLFWTPN
jgi:hypothetical protein